MNKNENTGGKYTALKNFLKKYKITRYPITVALIALKLGPNMAIRRVKDHLHINTFANLSKISKKRRKREAAQSFSKDIKFSILVPLYNTPKRYLAEMINSVCNQTYPNWELCLADGSDNEHSEVGEYVKKRQESDNRIVYKRLKKNLGISENTNECIKMSTGDYICLFDHDDYLHPSALYENMKAICQNSADFIYTDEAVFLGNNIRRITTYHLKPDYAVDNLRANNYICHFSVFSRQLLEKSGMFRSEYDGSQDHDIILRLTSNAKKVYHIRKILYFWRSHKNSVAMDLNSKAYAINAGINAVHDNIVACGEQCQVESSEAYPTIYRIKYTLKQEPLVSVVLYGGKSENTKQCIKSILSKTNYENLQLIVNKKDISDKEYLTVLEADTKFKCVLADKAGPYAEMNALAKLADGSHIAFVNANTEIITENWLEEMLMYSQRQDVGAVGGKILYSDGKIRHAGLIIGLGKDGAAFSSHNMYVDTSGYMGKLAYSQNVGAVSGECLMIKAELFEKMKGFDTDFQTDYADADLCLRLKAAGYLTVFTPYSELCYCENLSSKLRYCSAKNQHDAAYFKKKWQETALKNGDPYYNPNLSLKESYQVLYKKIVKECHN